jgi:DNA-directed RNA polymerase subunit M/transcription elongation factor TFIIS
MLPKIDVPIYYVNLISTGKKVRFRPFTVKEEKLFLMASEANDADEVARTIKQVLNNCILDEIDIENLPMFDVEYLFMNLRARSISEMVNIKYRCNNLVEKEGEEEKKKCNHVMEFDVNVLDVKPEMEEGHDKTIKITEKMGLVMKYPTLEMLEKYNNKENLDIVLDVIIDCIDYIYDADNMYYAKDATRDELVEFVDSMNGKDLEKINTFFNTMPKLKKKIDFNCGKCGYHEEIEVEGLQSFFF